MAAEQQVIDYGNTANDGTGDSLRDAFIKVDENFSNIWAAGPVGSNVTIVNNTIGVTDTNGNLILSPNGVGIIQTNNNVVPRANNTYNLGSANLTYRALYVGSGGATVTGNLTVGAIFTDNYYYANGAPFSGGGSGNYGNANVAAYLPVYGGNITAGNIGIFNNLVVNGNIDGAKLQIKTNANLAISNTWTILGNTLQAPTGASWRSDKETLDEYISSAANGYLNFSTFDAVSNIATQLHMEHGVVQINTFNGNDYTWSFNDTGVTDFPGNINTAGNVSAGYFLGNGSQLTGINASGTSISNGTSNVKIATSAGNVTASVNGVANVVTIGQTQLTVNGVIATPRTLTANISISENVSAMMISPLTIPSGLAITVPASSVFNIIP